MENTNTQPLATDNTTRAKRTMYAIWATIGVLVLTLIISLYSNASKASRIAVIEKDVTTLQYTLKAHDSTAAAHITTLNATIAIDSTKIATDKEAAAIIAKSITEINKELALIKK